MVATEESVNTGAGAGVAVGVAMDVGDMVDTAGSAFVKKSPAGFLRKVVNTSIDNNAPNSMKRVLFTKIHHLIPTGASPQPL